MFFFGVFFVFFLRKKSAIFRRFFGVFFVFFIFFENFKFLKMQKSEKSEKMRKMAFLVKNGQKGVPFLLCLLVEFSFWSKNGQKGLKTSKKGKNGQKGLKSGFFAFLTKNEKKSKNFVQKMVKKGQKRG